MSGAALPERNRAVEGLKGAMRPLVLATFPSIRTKWNWSVTRPMTHEIE